MVWVVRSVTTEVVAVEALDLHILCRFQEEVEVEVALPRSAALCVPEWAHAPLVFHPAQGHT